MSKRILTTYLYITQAETESLCQKYLGNRVVKWKEVMSALEGGQKSNKLYQEYEYRYEEQVGLEDVESRRLQQQTKSMFLGSRLRVEVRMQS